MVPNFHVSLPTRARPPQPQNSYQPLRPKFNAVLFNNQMKYTILLMVDLTIKMAMFVNLLLFTQNFIRPQLSIKDYNIYMYIGLKGTGDC